MSAHGDHGPMVQQVIDLQNRITLLRSKGLLDELTREEVGLLSYALGAFTAVLIQESRPKPQEGN